MPHSKDRNFTLDILRSFGLFLIILAHCEPPDILFQLRNFDVPLMVVISAATFSMLYKNKKMDYKHFYLKRLKKLILPAWYFLTFFFVTIFIGYNFVETSYPFSLHDVISSYLFYDGIGYVWILRIFLFIAILTPPLIYYKNKITNNYTYAGLIILTYIAYEVLAAQISNLPVNENILSILNTAILPIAPYAVLYAYGLKLEDISNKLLIIIAGSSLAIFIALALNYYHETGNIVGTQEMKYPPRLYYLSYAIFAINTLYLLIKYCYPKNILRSFWTWISTHSLWIYLWHIYAIFIWNTLYIDPDKNLILSIEKFLFVCMVAIIITKLQSICIEKIRRQTK